MPYQRKDIQILGGGFNCLPPGDKTPITDYLLAQNWRVDRAGKLVSRYGYQQKFSIANAGLAHSAVVYGGVSGAYYVGCNSSLTAPTGSLYYNFNPAAIATGFDGNRIAMCPLNSWMWVMNRGKQGRHNPAGGFQQWNLTAPSSSIAAASAATPTPSSSVTFTYAATGNPAYVHYLTIQGVTYQFVENGYSNAQIPLVMSLLAQNDPNATVQFSGTGNTLTITAIPQNTLIVVAGSDSNTTTSLANGAVTSLPNGTYQYYVTFATADDTLESNPGPVSNSVTLNSQAVALTGVPVSADARVGKRNIYATGGTLGQAYLVGTIADNTGTSTTISTPDLQATNNGVVMPTQNDPPPAASGMIGPFFSRLFAWSTSANPNRLFYTEPAIPQYWPGSGDPVLGNWVNVGDENEAIVWCTAHGNTLVIYKEKSIWMLVGDPASGYLQQVQSGIGLAGQFAVVAAGTFDYFVSAGGLFSFALDTMNPVGTQILPLFTSQVAGVGSLNPPGSILPGSAFNSTSPYPYAVSLGYAIGKLYVGYAEKVSGTRYCLMVYHEQSQRWFYHRNSIAGATAFFGFVFDGIQMVGLTGAPGAAALGENLDDFASYATTDPGAAAIECVHASHYENAGMPDNQKNWLEVVVDCELAGDSLKVYVGLDNGTLPYSLVGTITGTGRQSVGFGIALNGVTGAIEVRNPNITTQKDALARNISVALDCLASNAVIVHNVYLYYYEEARLAVSASTIPVDLGSGKIKQCKELELDIDAKNGPVSVQVISDLPGNALTVRQTPVVTQSGRASLKFPFAVTEGLLWRLAFAAQSGPFRLYGARLLMRIVGTYVEAYESAAGFVWDSQELTFDSGVTHIPRAAGIALAALPIKRAREITLQIETFGGAVTLNLLSDLPGNLQAVRFTAPVNTGGAGRRFVRIPLPAGTNAPIEGRMFRLQFSGGSKYILYEAAIEILAVGVYVEAYEAAGGAVYDSRELDFGSLKVKEAREIELDIETSGAVTATLYSDLPPVVIPGTGSVPSGAPGPLAVVWTGAANTTGRQSVRIPTTVNAALERFVAGRQFRLILSGANAYRLYGAKLKIREYGQFLTADEDAGGALWDSTPLDFGSQKVKALKRIEVDLVTFTNSVTVTVITEGVKYSYPLATNGGRRTMTLPIQPGIRGRLLQLQISGTACALYAVRAYWRPLNDSKAEWQWTDMPCEPTQPQWTWAPFPVNPTEAQWFWGKVLSVEETSEVWTLVDVDVQVNG